MGYLIIPRSALAIKSLTLFAFDKGEEKHALHAGETIIMPAKVPHAVYATERFKMFLTVVFPSRK